MSLIIPMAFIIVFIVLLWAISEPFSLLVYGIFLLYVFLNFTEFFTDTITADLLNNLNLLVGVICILSFGKMVYIGDKKRKELYES